MGPGPDSLFERAEHLEQEGNLQEACECWRLLAEEQRDDPAVSCRLAGVLVELGLEDEASRAFSHALSIDPGCIAAAKGLSFILMEREENELVERVLVNATKYEKDATVYFLLGIVQDRLGKRDEAKHNFESALKLRPDYEEAYFNLGLLFREESPAEAERLMRKALEIDSNYAPAHREVGWILVGRGGDLAAAEYHLQRSIELDPGNEWAHIYLGNLMWRKGDLPAARTAFMQALELAPAQAFPKSLFAEFLEGTKELDQAQLLYEEALSIDPADADLMVRLAGVLRKRGNSGSARDYLVSALQVVPDHPAALRLLSELDRL